MPPIAAASRALYRSGTALLVALVSFLLPLSPLLQGAIRSAGLHACCRRDAHPCCHKPPSPDGGLFLSPAPECLNQCGQASSSRIAAPLLPGRARGAVAVLPLGSELNISLPGPFANHAVYAHLYQRPPPPLLDPA